MIDDCSSVLFSCLFHSRLPRKLGERAGRNHESTVQIFGKPLTPISAKLFCKRSQVILKDERPTSNIERPTSNEKQISDTEHSTAISVSSQPF